MSAFTQPSPRPRREPSQPAPGPVPVPPPAEPRPPRRWLLPLGVVAAIVLGGALYLLLRPGSQTQTGSTGLVQTAQVTTGPIERSVRISGQTSARDFVTIRVPVFRGPDSGRELTLMNLATPGATVKQGDIVAELDAQTLRDHLDDVSDQVLQAENNVLKKKAEQEVEWESLQQSLRVAKADRDKARLDLSAAEVKTEVERELLKLTADEAEAAYTQLQRDLANKKAADLAELRILEITARQEHLHWERHESDLQRFKIRAPMGGLVVMSQLFRGGQMHQTQEGDMVHPGQEFMKIVDPRSMQVEALVSQADSSEFRVGQRAIVGLDAFPGLRLRGRIYSIGAMAVKGMWDTYYIRNVPVLVAIEDTDSRLIPDLSAWANVPIERVESAAIIPSEAVRIDGTRSVVYVKNGKGFEKRPVELGVRTPTQVSIASGLRPGEVVALGPVKM
jgi:HlyD family secretion protein